MKRTAWRRLPVLQQLMDKNHIPSVEKLFEKIQPYLLSAEDRSPDDLKPTLSRLQNIITGKISPWHHYNGSPVLEAMALVRLFDRDATGLFGKAPVITSKRSADYNPAVHAGFKKALFAAGYRSIHELEKVLVSGEKTWERYQSITKLARGEQSPVYNGVFSDLANDVATALDLSPEELFLCCPLNKERKAIAHEKKLSVDTLNGNWRLLAVRSPEDFIISGQRSDFIRSKLEVLTPRERMVIVRFCGWDGDESASLEEIRKEMRISPQWAQKLKERALNKLRPLFYNYAPV